MSNTLRVFFRRSRASALVSPGLAATAFVLAGCGGGGGSPGSTTALLAPATASQTSASTTSGGTATAGQTAGSITSGSDTTTGDGGGTTTAGSTTSGGGSTTTAGQTAGSTSSGGGSTTTPDVPAGPQPLSVPSQPATVATVQPATGDNNTFGFGGLFFSVPDTNSVKVGDRSPDGGNASSLTFNTPSVSYIVEQPLTNGTAIEGSKALQVDAVATNASGDFVAAVFSNGTAATKVLSVVGATGPSSTDLLTSAYYGAYTEESVVRNDTGAPVSNSFVVGSLFGGDLTAKSDLPKNVIANYSGSFAGFGTATDGTAGNNKSGYTAGYTGGVELIANFGAGTVTGNAYNLQQTVTSPSGADITTPASFGLRVDAKIDPVAGNTYQGVTNFTNATTLAGAPAVAGATRGNAVGAFYGPQAAETAGAVQVEGTAPGVSSPIIVQGSYGAKK